MKLVDRISVGSKRAANARKAFRMNHMTEADELRAVNESLEDVKHKDLAGRWSKNISSLMVRVAERGAEAIIDQAALQSNAHAQKLQAMSPTADAGNAHASGTSDAQPGDIPGAAAQEAQLAAEAAARAETPGIASHGLLLLHAHEGKLTCAGSAHFAMSPLRLHNIMHEVNEAVREFDAQRHAQWVLDGRAVALTEGSVVTQAPPGMLVTQSASAEATLKQHLQQCWVKVLELGAQGLPCSMDECVEFVQSSGATCSFKRSLCVFAAELAHHACQHILCAHSTPRIYFPPSSLHPHDARMWLWSFCVSQART